MQAVIFDWGGTLSIWADVDMEDMWRLAARHLAPSREEEMTAALIEFESRSWDRIKTDQRSTRLADLLAEASEAFGLDVAAAVLEEASGHYLDTWTPHIHHKPDAVATLGELRRLGLRIGLLSNTHWPSGFHEHFLERDGLAGLIDARLYTSEMEFVKPHPSVFRAALDAVGVDDPAEAVFVGDRLHDDIWGARSSGMRGVWVRNTIGVAEGVTPDATIETLSELPGLVAGWSR